MALSALVACSDMADATTLALEQQELSSHVEATVKPNAHRAPKVDAKSLLERFLALVAAREDDVVAAPGESPDFDNEGLAAWLSRARLRHIGQHSPGASGLWLACRIDRLRAGADPNFHLFGSALSLSGIPTS